MLDAVADHRPPGPPGAPDVFSPDQVMDVEREMARDERTSAMIMSQLDGALGKVAELLKMLSIHAEYSPRIHANAAIIAATLLNTAERDQATPRPTERRERTPPTTSTPDHLKEIANALAKVTSRLDAIEAKVTTTKTPPAAASPTPTANARRTTNNKATTPPTTKAPKTNVATTKPITPTPKAVKAAVVRTVVNPTPTNPLAAHHPSRLIVEIKDGPGPNDRPKEVEIVRHINEVLQSSGAGKIRVVNVKFNDQNNCIIFTRADQSAAELAPHADSFIEFFAGRRPTRVRPDRPWYKVQLNGVPTRVDWTREIATPEKLHEELKINNPAYEEMEILALPRWMRHESDLMGLLRSSVVIALANEADADHLVKEVKFLAIAGHFAEAKRYADKPPVMQCSRCWAFGHTRSRCKKEVLCRICSGPHPEEKHVCTTCTEKDPDNQNMEDCMHHLKCVNCKYDHTANFRNCPVRLRQVGTSRSQPSKQTGGAQTHGAWKETKNKDRKAAPRPSQAARKTTATEDATSGKTAHVPKHIPTYFNIK
ncbi:hypothetical protein EVJ58_g10584 [Rhodofomes roseus]|uniref:Gag-like protein n=1 Tax=Rhodofomes roseus TaxID=34475 RepID=A0A4Y9XPX3_9APHY|nr:hypothetical protein EVJ58_g10584 [Rhodofomes roseus]